MHKAIVVLSGGQDSTTCLFWAKERFELHLLTFDYGQRHRREIQAAVEVAAIAGIPPERHEILKVGPILKGTSPLVSDEELEQYKDHQSLPGGLEKTFVPMRNQLFLTLAANRAACIGARALITGVCEEEYGGYPDCRTVFIQALEEAINLGTFTALVGAYPRIHVITPLMALTKAKTVELALTLADCYKALAWTHTSYDGQYPPTGKDHATLLRAKGFEEAGVPDPLVLRAFHEGLMDLPDASNYKWTPQMRTDLPEKKPLEYWMNRAGLE